ncbi:MAG: SAM-dependent methyltransferase [Anaerolineae bacterium]
MRPNRREAGSFRDPAGFLFWREGVLYRQINRSGKDDYAFLMKSGLYQSLVDDGLLVPHVEVDAAPHEPGSAFRVIRPERIPFISYPYEWSFGQLKDAALATLAIQKRALAYGMSMKDSSAYNIQFWRGEPVLMDTLSFETWEDGQPWVAYRQFCQHFLAPLALMAYRDARLGQLLRIYIDGVPLGLASKLLPLRTRLRFPLLTHLHLHAVAQKRYAGREVDLSSSRQVIRKTGILGILGSLESIIRQLDWNPEGTVWADYESTHSYADASIRHKKRIVSDYLERVRPQTVWDLGANTGVFGRLASQRMIHTVAFDVDPGVVELNYRQCVADKEQYLLPLLLDLTNPSPCLGWHNRERLSLLKRASADMVLALALVHHLAIANNLPLEQIACFLADLGHWLVIEFVPKDDPQTRKLLASREDIFVDYSRRGLEEAFSYHYQIEDSVIINESARTLYLMERI